MSKTGRNAEIIRRRKAGQYPSDIARAMDLTRNTVIGVCWREGLTFNDRQESSNAHRMAVRGENCRQAKLTDEAVREIRRNYVYLSRGSGMPALAKKYGVAVNAIRRVLIGKTWKHVE